MNILDTIIEYKKEEVKSKKSKVKTVELEKRKWFSRTVLPLKDSLLDRSRTGIIAEFKRRSPSKGIINPDVDVMEQMGYKFKNDNERLKKELEVSNICFLHAPLFHPALKTVGPIRKNLAMRTFFNMLGPMVNPSNPKYQLVGVFSLEMARIYNYLLQQTERSFTIIHSLDGYDEISLTNDTKVITNEGESIKTPEQLGKRMVEPTDIQGGNTVEEAAKIFLKILKGDGSWAQNAVVLANASMALYCTGNYKTYEDAFNAAIESLESGKAKKSLDKLISLQTP